MAGPLPPVSCASQFPVVLLVGVGWIRLLPQLETNTALASNVKNASFLIDPFKLQIAFESKKLKATTGYFDPLLRQTNPRSSTQISLLRIERCGQGSQWMYTPIGVPALQDCGRTVPNT